MSLAGKIFSIACKRSDEKRDATVIPTEGVECICDLTYRENGDKYNLLDIYYPVGTAQALPTIISFHGGGYVYGTKEIYKYYGMFLASLGFTFVNFNYHLAPKYKYPTQITEANEVLLWCQDRANEYFMDMENVFMVGDSAGAQLLSQYTTIFTNPEYAALFDFEVPKGINVRGIALNCGIYDVGTDDNTVKSLIVDYFGKNMEKFGQQLKPLDYIDSNYPPTYIMTSAHDFLSQNAAPMYELLLSRNVEAEMKNYGTKEQEYMGHVCHVNMNLEEAKQINRDEADFFKKHIK